MCNFGSGEVGETKFYLRNFYLLVLLPVLKVLMAVMLAFYLISFLLSPELDTSWVPSTEI